MAHVSPDSATFTNALIHEQSPYLLQHAHNPVNWRAWSDATFELAKREDKPIFLSIGYATCHWCHVMERESFENVNTSDFINEHYIAIKVDREERPDIDAIYMSVCQALTGHGGWPLTIFMDADKKPFFAGTYFPPENHPNRPGFPYLLQHIENAWRTERSKIVESCEAIVEHLSAKKQTTNNAATPALTLPTDILHQTFSRYEQTFDPHYGGFGSQPKFPSPQNLLLLLRYHKRTGNTAPLAMVERTLRAMRKGGVFDQLGYGFHRYSTDREWLVPHFEKMLYDQAMMALACLETFQITRDEAYSRIAEEIFTYVLRDMTDANGGFYSAEDADSEGHEGKFYVWRSEEVRAVLGDGDGYLFAALYNFSDEGNFEDEATRERTGDNIPHLRLSLEDFATAHSIDADELRARISTMRERLFTHREKRVHPLKDDKILTDWNGLMIAAFAFGGRVLDNALYTQVAERALEFIQTKMFAKNEDGDMKRLLHRYRLGNDAIPAFLDDYAFVAWGAFELYQTTFSLKYLETTLFLCDEMLRLFANTEDGGFYFSAEDNERLIVRTQEAYDGAIPSGNSIAASVLARVGKLTSRTHYTDAAKRTIAHFAAHVQQHPTGFAQMLMAHDMLSGGVTQEIIIAGSTMDIATHEMLRCIADAYLPHAVMAFNHTPHSVKHFIEQAEYQTSANGAATAYFCENFTCKAPMTDVGEVRRALAEMA
jgi:uncharacterized protein YyaL (SSP411 family)